MKSIKLFQLLLIINLFFTIHCSDKKENNMFLGFLAFLLGQPAPAANLDSGNTSETPPNPSDEGYFTNTTGTDPQDTTDFGAGGVVVPPPTPLGPPTPPAIGPEVPFGDISPNITGVVLKTPTVVDRYQDIIIEFSENMKRETVCLGESNGALTITGIAANERSCRWATDKQLLIRHYKALNPSTSYTVSISNAAESLYDSTRKFVNFTNPTAVGNSYTFTTEPEHKVTFTINHNGTNYVITNEKGLNLDTKLGATSIAITAVNNSTGAEIIELRKIGSDDIYQICSGGCATTFLSNFNLITNGALPASLLVSNGMNSYFVIIKSKVSDTPLQYKNYYRTFNFNYGPHSAVPMGIQTSTGSLVLEKGQAHWAGIGSMGSTQGTLDVLAYLLEHFAEKSFKLVTAYGTETFNDILRRDMGTTMSPTCYRPSTNSNITCPDFDAPQRARKRAAPYGIYPAGEEGQLYVPSKPTLPFSYFTKVGPFGGLTLPGGADGYYYFDDLDTVTSSTISAGISDILTNGLNLPGFIADILGDVLSFIINGMVSLFVDILNGSGAILGGEPSALRLVYNFQADAYITQAVVGTAVYSDGGATLTPSSTYESTLIDPKINIIGDRLSVLMNARELHASLKLALDLNKVLIQLFFLDFSQGFPFNVNVSSDVNDWFEELCIVDVCAPNFLDPKWPPPITVTPITTWYSLSFLDPITTILKGFYIFRIYADMNTPETNPAFYEKSGYSPRPPGFPKSYADSSIKANGSTDASNNLSLFVDNPVYLHGTDISAIQWYDGLQPSISTVPLPNPSILASASDLGNAKDSMNNVNPGDPVAGILWGIFRQMLGDPGAAFVNGLLSVILNDAVVKAFPAVKPYIVNGLLNDIIRNIATDIFNAILAPLKKGVKLDMPDFTPEPIKSLVLNLGIQLTANKTGLIQTHANGSQGIVAPLDLKLVAGNKNFAGETCQYGVNDIAEVCPPLPDGNPTGQSSFARSRPFANWNNDLPNPLEYSYNNPGALLGVHPDAISQFFFTLWKNGGLNMTIDETFLNTLANYRDPTDNEPVRLLRELLKTENLIGILVPSGVVDPVISGDPDILIKAFDSANGNAVRYIRKSDRILLKLRPMQAPYVSVDPPIDGSDYVPLLNLTLSDVEVQIFAQPQVGPEYRILTFRLNLNTRAELRAGAFNGTTQTAADNPNRIALKLDICNDTLGEYKAGNPAIDCDLRNTQFGVKKFTSYSIAVPDVTWNNQFANPLGISPTGIGNVLGAVTKTVLIPVFNYILGEIPLALLGHCGIEVNQKYRKVSSNADNVKILPIKASSAEPFFLINARTEIYDNSATIGSVFDNINITPGVPPRFTGECKLIAP